VRASRGRLPRDTRTVAFSGPGKAPQACTDAVFGAKRRRRHAAPPIIATIAAPAAYVLGSGTAVRVTHTLSMARPWSVTEASSISRQRRKMKLFAGKFRPETLEGSNVVPEIVLSSVAQLPEWLERSL